jgi:hypothetical protein
MDSLRAFFLQYRSAAILLVLAALCMKSLVPTGYMIGQEGKALTVQICNDALSDHAIKNIALPMKEGSGGSGLKQSKAECPYSAMSMAALSGADPALLALALAFIVALGFAPSPVPAARRALYLRPPLRGPPSLA